MGAKQPNKITQTNKVELSPEQQEIFGLALPNIRDYAGSNISLFPGSGVAGFDPAETSAQDYALNTAATSASDLAGRAGSTQALLLDPGFMLNPNQYLQPAAEAVTRQTTENLTENILPKIRTGSTVAGGQYSGGSTRQGIAEGQAVGRTSREISDALAKMYLDNYQKGLAGLSQATTNNANVLMQQMFPANIMSAVGAQRRGLAQAQLDEQIRKFYTGQDLPLLKSQQLLGLISGMPGATGQTTVQGATPQANPWMQALGLGLTLAGGMAGVPGMGLGMGTGGMGLGMGMGK